MIDFNSVLQARAYAAEEAQRLLDLEAADVEQDLEAFQTAVAAQGEKARIVREAIGSEAEGMSVELLAHIHDETLQRRVDGMRRSVNLLDAAMLRTGKTSLQRKLDASRESVEKILARMDASAKAWDEDIAAQRERARNAPQPFVASSGSAWGKSRGWNERSQPSEGTGADDA